MPERRIVLRRERGAKTERALEICTGFSCIHNERMYMRKLLKARERMSGREYSEQSLMITRDENTLVCVLKMQKGKVLRIHKTHGRILKMGIASMGGEWGAKFSLD